jgi:glycosyltransferase involved in cell wall biosynthesis
MRTTPASAAAPLVSVVVPAYNAARYLGDALRSLFDQTLADIEIIVVDDGSRDDTRAIAERHAADDARVRVIARETPSGRPSIARNQALAAARGRYIAFLDADDTSIPTRLESMVRALQRTGALFGFADKRRLYEDTGELAPESTLAAAKFVERATRYLEHVQGNVYLCTASFPAFLFEFIAINTSTVVLDRALLALEPTWFDETLVCFEDVDLWFRLAEHTRFAFVNEVHTIMRKHSASITASSPVETRIDGIAVRRAHLARLRGRLTPTEVEAAEVTLSELQFHVAYAQRCAGNGPGARDWYRESWRTRRSSAAALGYLKSFLPKRNDGVARTVERREAAERE